jgi:hypothetical protein
MSTDTRLILNLPAEPERFERRERADYELDRFEKEFPERLYSDKGREILRASEQREARPANGEADPLSRGQSCLTVRRPGEWAERMLGCVCRRSGDFRCD